MKTLNGLDWRPKWTSHLGCLHGCLDYVGVEVSEGWLYGATGHAFVLNIHDQLCPSGPTAWRAGSIHRLGKNIGYSPNAVFGFKLDPDFSEKQERAWVSVRAAIDAGLPCYGWELAIPEYHVVHGYDATGYLYRGPGCDGGAGPKAWATLGDSGIGVLEVYTIGPGTAASDAEVVRAALEFALQFSRDPSPWVFPGYTGGVGAYDAWIAALESGTADGMGAAYNASVWSECRTFAAEFLDEASARLSPELHDLFGDAESSYRTVAAKLGDVSTTFPFIHAAGPDEDGAMEENVADSGRREAAIAALHAARQAEEEGLVALGAIAERIGC